MAERLQVVCEGDSDPISIRVYSSDLSFDSELPFSCEFFQFAHPNMDLATEMRFVEEQHVGRSARYNNRLCDHSMSRDDLELSLSRHSNTVAEHTRC